MLDANLLIYDEIKETILQNQQKCAKTVFLMSILNFTRYKKVVVF